MKYLPETGVPPHTAWWVVIGGGGVIIIALMVGFGALVWHRQRQDD